MNLLRFLFLFSPALAAHDTPPVTALEDDCHNSLCGIGQHISIRDVPGKGKGAFTTVAIKKDAFLGYYFGEFLTSAEVYERYPDVYLGVEATAEGGASYLFSLNDEDDEDDLYVDAAISFNWVRYVNHSTRRHNAIGFIDDSEPERPRVYLEALRDIAAGEEILIDYGEGYWEGVSFSVLD